MHTWSKTILSGVYKKQLVCFALEVNTSIWDNNKLDHKTQNVKL